MIEKSPVCPECGGPLTEYPWGRHTRLEWSCTPCMKTAGGRCEPEPEGKLIALSGKEEIEAYLKEREDAGWISAHERVAYITEDQWPTCPRCRQPMKPGDGTSRIWYDCLLKC